MAMISNCVVFFVVVLGVVLADPPVLTGYDFSRDLTPFLDKPGCNAIVYWTVDVANAELDVGFVGTQLDWAGIGISLDGYMIPTIETNFSDAVVIHSDGDTVDLTDFRLAGRYPPPYCAGNEGAAACLDTDLEGCEDNIVTHSAGVQDGFFVVEFSRPLAASDACDLEIPLDGTQVYFISSLGLYSGTTGFPNSMIEHYTKIGAKTAPVTFVSPDTKTDTGSQTTSTETSSSDTSSSETSSSQTTSSQTSSSDTSSDTSSSSSSQTSSSDSTDTSETTSETSSSSQTQTETSETKTTSTQDAASSASTLLSQASLVVAGSVVLTLF